jgi:hypothetical protein
MILLLVFDYVFSAISGDSVPWYLRPVLWFLTPWIFGAFLFAMPIISHREVLEFEHVVYIGLCLSLLVFGSLNLRFRGARKVAQADSKRFEVKPKMMYLLLILAVLGQASILIDGVATGAVNLVARLSGEGLAETRANAFAANMLGVRGPLHLLESFASFALIYIVCLVCSDRKALSHSLRRRYWAGGVVVSLGMLANAFLVLGGRINIVILILTWTISFLMEPYRVTLMRLWRASFGKKVAVTTMAVCVSLAGLTYFSTVFVEKRAGKQSALTTLAVSHRADIYPWLYTLTKDAETVRYGIFTLSYFTTPLATLSYYLDLGERKMPGPYFGQYNFPGVADRIIKRIAPEQQMGWWEARLDLFQPLVSQGYGGNVWATLIRDVIADVGLWLTPLVFFLLGLTVRSYANRGANGGSPLWAAGYVGWLIFLLFSLFHSQFFIQGVFWLIFGPPLISSVLAVRRFVGGSRSASSGVALPGVLTDGSPITSR